MTTKNVLPWVLVFGAGLCLRTGISSLSPVLTDIQAATGVSIAALGVLTAIPVICMGVLSPVGHFVERRLGLRNAMVAALLLLSLSIATRIFNTNFAILLMTAGGVGIADAIIRPLVSGYIKERFENASGQAMSIYAASMGIGSALAAYGTGPIGELAGQWSYGLAFWALPAILTMIFWLVWGGSGSIHQTGATATPSVSRREVVAFTLFFGLQAGINYSTIAWLPSFFEAKGFDSADGSMWVTVYVVLQTIMSLFYHTAVRSLRLSTGSATVVYVSITLVGAIGLLLVGPAPWLAPIALGIGTGGLFPIALLMPLDFTQNRHEATQLSGVTQAGGYVLGGILPWLVGVGSQFLGASLGISLVVILSACAIVVVSVIIVGSYRRKHLTDRWEQASTPE